MKSKILPLCVLSLSLVGCKAMKDIQAVPAATLDMGDTTKAMAKTTDSLKAGTDRVELISQDLRYISEQLKVFSVAGIGSELRDLNYARIKNAESMSEKLLHATKYMESFDFQMWNVSTDPKIQDSTLIDLYAKHGVQEFALKLSATLPEGTKIENTALSKDPKMENFYALVATMHKVNMFQEVLDQDDSREERTMFNYVVEGLRNRKTLEDGSVLVGDIKTEDKSVYEALKAEGLFESALQIRYKFLPLVALAKISHVDNGFLSQVKMLLGKWSPDFSTYDPNFVEPVKYVEIFGIKLWKKKSKDELNFDSVKHLNAAQIDYATTILDYALQTRDIIKELKLKPAPRLDKNASKIFKNLQINMDSLKGEISVEKMKSVNAFNEKLTELLKEE